MHCCRRQASPLQRDSIPRLGQEVGNSLYMYQKYVENSNFMKGGKREERRSAQSVPCAADVPCGAAGWTGDRHAPPPRRRTAFKVHCKNVCIVTFQTRPTSDLGQWTPQQQQEKILKKPIVEKNVISGQVFVYLATSSTLHDRSDVTITECLSSCRCAEADDCD